MMRDDEAGSSNAVTAAHGSCPMRVPESDTDSAANPNARKPGADEPRACGAVNRSAAQ